MGDRGGFLSKLRGFLPQKRREPAIFAESQQEQRAVLAREFAVRNTWDHLSALSHLPNPDPVLRSEGKSLEVYRAMTDGHLGAVVRKRRAAVRARPWLLEANGSASRSTKQMQAIFNALNIRQATTTIWQANTLGYSVLEVIWENRGGWWVPAILKDKPQEWFGWHTDGSFRFITDQGIGEPVPPRKFLVARHDPSYLNPYGKPLLSECFWPLAFKRGGLKFWMTFLEKYGMPRAIGKVPPGTPEADREALLVALSGMARDAVAVISDNQTVELQEATGKAGSADAYAAIVHWADTEISKAILGETLSTELGTVGSLAAAEVHNEVRKDLAQDDADLVCGIYNQLIDWIYELNAPTESARVRFKIQMPEDLKSGRVARDKDLSGMMKLTGKSFSGEYFSDTYDIDPKYLVDVKERTSPAPVPVPAAGPAFAERTTHDCAHHGAEFAEGEIGGDQDLMNLFRSLSPQELQGQIEELVQPILDLAAKQASFAEFEDALDELFPTLTFEQFQATMEKCLLLSEAKGRSNAG